MAAIRYLTPYEVVLSGSDRASGKPIRNILYYRSGVSGGGLAYGEAIVGTSQAEFHTRLLTKLTDYWVPVQPTTMRWQQIRSEAIYGKGYPTPRIGIAALAFGVSTSTIATTGPHGLASGQMATISGVGTPGGINGDWIVTVVDDTIFTIAASFSPPWSGNGIVQSIGGQAGFAFVDRYETNFTLDGTVASDALPLFSTASVRRINSGVGRNWRSRISVSPIPESHWLDGTMQAAGIAPWTTWQTQMVIKVPTIASPSNDSHYLQPAVVSKALAMGLSSPFESSTSWCQDLTSWDVRENNGSMIRRKPKLTAAITPPA